MERRRMVQRYSGHGRKGGGEELGHFRKFENVLCVVIIFYMKFDLRIYRGRANIRTLATALQCRL